MAKPPIWVLTERELCAGTDADTGLPVIDLQTRAWGGPPDQRHLVAPETALRVGAQLVAAGNPALVLTLLEEVVESRLGRSPVGTAALEGDNDRLRMALRSVLRVLKDSKRTNFDAREAVLAMVETVLAGGRVR